MEGIMGNGKGVEKLFLDIRIKNKSISYFKRIMRLIVAIMISILVFGVTFASKMHGDSGTDVGLQNNGLYQGDIADITYSNSFQTGIPNPSRLWSNKTVNYNIANSVQHLQRQIALAIKQIEDETCLKFKEVPLFDPVDHVHFTRKDGCWSHLGRRGGGQQDLSLGDECHPLGIVLHEILHALGLAHEHTRSDRDEHVKVLWENIEDGQRQNFEKLFPWENNLLDETFDFDSVMMYGNRAFSANGERRTLESRSNPSRNFPDVGEKRELSAGDVRKINKLYECHGYERPTLPEVPPFSCDFETQHCGLYNQEEAGLATWITKTGPLLTLLGDHTTGFGAYLAVSASEADGLPARLLSSNFLSYDREEGCLSFQLHFSGDGADSFKVYIQSENGLNKIFHEFQPSFLQWKRIQINIKPMLTSFRFFFEALTAESEEGLIAIDDLRFKWKKC